MIRKELEFMKSIKRKLCFAILAAVMLITLFSFPAQAATRNKTVKVYSCDFKKGLPSLPSVRKKICTVQFGRTRVKVKTGLIKFTPKKSGKYVFTFSGLTGAGYGNVLFLEQIPFSDMLQFIDDDRVKTAGGYSSVLWLCKKSEAAYYASAKEFKNKLERPLSKRSGTIRLQKGEPVYLYLDFSGKKYSKITLKISRQK